MASNNDNAISNEEDIMDKNDRQAIENLFEKLATVELSRLSTCKGRAWRPREGGQ